MGAITDSQVWLMNSLLNQEDGTANGGQIAWKSGYHSTEEYNAEHFPGNYSIRDAIDREGPNDKCAAFDWTFRDAQRKDYDTIAKYMKRLRTSGMNPHDPRLDGWREFYGQADGDLYIEGYDVRYDKEVTSDSSHLWHIHGSETRKYVESMTNKLNLMSVVKGESVAVWRAAGGKAVWEVDGGKPSVPTRPPVKSPAPGKPIAYPLPSGHWFGVDDGTNASHAGLSGRVTRGKRDSEWIQIFVNQLKLRGWDARKGGRFLTRYGNDGGFGSEMSELVGEFQEDQRLGKDRKLGPKTWNAAFLNPVT